MRIGSSKLGIALVAGGLLMVPQSSVQSRAQTADVVVVGGILYSYPGFQWVGGDLSPASFFSSAPLGCTDLGLACQITGSGPGTNFVCGTDILDGTAQIWTAGVPVVSSPHVVNFGYEIFLVGGVGVLIPNFTTPALAYGVVTLAPDTGRFLPAIPVPSQQGLGLCTQAFDLTAVMVLVGTS